MEKLSVQCAGLSYNFSSAVHIGRAVIKRASTRHPFPLRCCPQPAYLAPPQLQHAPHRSPQFLGFIHCRKVPIFRALTIYLLYSFRCPGYNKFFTMSLQEQFDTAAEQVKNLKSTPADADLLELYALFKQATVGDVNTARPGMLDFKGKAKWDAWESKKGTSQDAAKEAYVAKVKDLVEKHGV